MKRITFWILSIVCLTACNDVMILDPAPVPTAPVEMGEAIRLILPDASDMGLNTYSTATQSECYIKNVWVILFNGQGNIKEREVEGVMVKCDTLIKTNITGNGQATQLLPQTRFKLQTGDTVVCIANTSVTNITGLTYSTINSHFALTKPYYIGGDSLPMYGIKIPWQAGSPSIELTRAVAKIQVRMGESVPDITPNFSAETVEFAIVNYAREGRIQPNSPGLPQTGSTYVKSSYFKLLQNPGATESATTAYIYEFPSATTKGLGSGTIGNKTFDKDRQFILLKKKIGNDSTFYRLDFYNRYDSVFLDTKRNSHYIFTINKVRSEGYKTANEAYYNAGSNIEYTVRDSSSMGITSNGQYAIVTGIGLDTLAVRAGITSDTTITTVKYIDPTNLVSSITTLTNSVALENVTPSNSLTLNWTGNITATPKDVKITTTSAFQSGTIVFKLGNITHRLPIKKKT